MELWFSEEHTDHTRLSFRVEKVLYSDYSKYQRIDVLETPDWGKVLLLDGKVMLTEKDEFIYHEMITHPALFIHPSPQRILVIGGGDGGTVREITRHKKVKEIDLCEIDKAVIEISRQYFPHLSEKLSDRRVKIHVEDGGEFINKKKNYYDIIIIDSTDPSEVSQGLFTSEFYEMVSKSLNEGGILIVQSESVINNPQLVKDIYWKIKKSFPQTYLYWAPIPTYPGGIWTFTLGSKKYSPLEDFLQDYWERFNQELRYYNPSIHRAAFALPNFVEKELSLRNETLL
ncbi:MAG: polyamine aminopropyltransferase [Caldiserica bacterium]|nr:polyamine aminopropyltransferase [Caldisericota bacterium]